LVVGMAAPLSLHGKGDYYKVAPRPEDRLLHW
jgi:hypothetical protein